MTKQDDTPPQNLPFPKRWLWYIAIKIILLAVLGFAVLRWKGLL